MTRSLRTGLWLAAAHLTIVGGVAGKYLLDRATKPRVWARAAPVDPELPIRGRYISLRLEAAQDGVANDVSWVRLSVRDRALVATPTGDLSAVRASLAARAGLSVVVLTEPLVYFIPDQVDDPSRLAPGEELWAEVTVPDTGAPRPIRLGVKRGTSITPLEIR